MGADGGHRAAQRVPGKPNRLLRAHESLLDDRPKTVRVLLETTMHTTHRFGQHGHGVGVGLHVAPLVALGAAADNHTVMRVPKSIRLSPVPIEVQSPLKPDLPHANQRGLGRHIGNLR